MVRSRTRSAKLGLRHALVMTLAIACASLLSPPAHAALLPPSFFDRIPETTSGQAGVEADQLFFNSETNVITAHGHVGLSYSGYYATADHMVFNQTTRDLELTGNVVIVDPDGTQYKATHVVLTGGFKNAVLESMSMLSTDGAMVTADRTEKIRGERTILINGAYTPCGECIGKNGKTIGWRVRSTRMEHNTVDHYVDVEQPVLEVLGVPVAWFPWMRLPDPTDERFSNFRAPSYSYTDKIGWKLSLPYYSALDRDMGVLFTPSLVTSQGLLLSTEFAHNVGNIGRYSVTASGIYQLNPDKFTPGFGNTNWRGAIQTSGQFTPVEHWTTGWSYTTFTDPAFLTDYLIPTDSPVTNEVYAEYLTDDTFAEARVQEFVLLGEIAKATQDKQARALPFGRFNHLVDLGPDNGEIQVEGEFLNVDRTADSTATAGGVPYVTGYAGQKAHGVVQAMWSRQFIAGGLAITPYAGARFDAASYNGGSALNPVASTLYTATPFAALDMRYPFIASDGGTTHVIEPIAQLVYRASDVTATGITNDNAQSFVFDDSNVFSFNRFSGTDRQETGLRANIGGHYLASFEDGSYLDFIVGQSFHLAGLNALSTADAANAGVGAGLSNSASDIVVGLRGKAGSLLTYGAKAGLDVSTASISKVALDTHLAFEGWALGVDYSYLAADPARGALIAQQDLGGSVSVPLADYWTANASAGWNLTAGELINYGLDVTYDDGYVMLKADVTSTGPLVYDPDTLTYRLTFKLRGADGTGIGYGISPQSWFK